MDTDSLVLLAAKFGLTALFGISLFALLYRMITDAMQVHITRTRFNEVQHRVVNDLHGLSKPRERAEVIGNQTKKTLVAPGAVSSLVLRPAPPWLLELYNNQIEKYQADTQQRATISFFFAILAMSTGIGFVVWAGSYSITSDSVLKTVGTAAISTVGVTLSAYITKTFSDLHRVSLEQLNRYFRQPVLNEHVLTVERLAEQLSDGAKESAYVRLIDKILSLMADGNLADPTKIATTPPDVSGSDGK
jgi:hypothetical protein